MPVDLGTISNSMSWQGIDSLATGRFATIFKMQSADNIWIKLMSKHFKDLFCCKLTD